VLHAVFSRRNWRLDLGLLMLLVESGADLHARDARGWTPLHAAAERGRREAVEFLLDKGVDLKATDNDGQFPLHLAATRGNYKVIKLLVARGADIHSKDSYGRTPAGLMVKNCFEELEKTLKSGDEAEGICSTHPELKSYLLLYASVEGHLEMVRHLVEKGADVNVRRSFHAALAVPGVTPLHGAASEGHLEVARFLLSSGARTDLKDRYGRSALQWATWKQHKQIADLLRRSTSKATQRKD
jgi:ankyrin repeat protein